jgi:hypothetical protein
MPPPRARPKAEIALNGVVDRMIGRMSVCGHARVVDDHGAGTTRDELGISGAPVRLGVKVIAVAG